MSYTRTIRNKCCQLKIEVKQVSWFLLQSSREEEENKEIPLLITKYLFDQSLNLITFLKDKAKIFQVNIRKKTLFLQITNKEETYFSKDSASPSSIKNIDLIGTMDIVSELKTFNEYYQFNPSYNKKKTSVGDTNNAKVEEELAFNTSELIDISHNSSVINLKDNGEANISIDEYPHVPSTADHKGNQNQNSNSKTDSANDMNLFKFGFHCMDIFMESALDHRD